MISWSVSGLRMRPASRRRIIRGVCAGDWTSRRASSLSPPVLFLDEPTTGLDPRGRNEVWEAVRRWSGGTTVLLTTQYLDEADQLADRICVRRRAAIAEGTPEDLKSRVGGDRIDVVVRSAGELPVAARVVGRVCGAEPEVDRESRRVSAPVMDRLSALTGTVRALDDVGVDAEDIGLRRPTLDDVFLRLTGHRAGEKKKRWPHDASDPDDTT